jgi:hypothetical protein
MLIDGPAGMSRCVRIAQEILERPFTIPSKRFTGSRRSLPRSVRGPASLSARRACALLT